MTLLEFITILIRIVALYFILGISFLIYFYAKGLRQIDPAVKGSSLLFKLLLAPAATALWPFLLVKTLNIPKHESDTKKTTSD